MTSSNRIAMWSGPRNLSTAMMYSFAARGDCAAWDEPFYAAYLRATGIEHPMREQIISAHENDPKKVAAACGTGPIPQGKSLFYQKHMTLHMIPGFDRSFMQKCQNVFLIRHPARVVASYAKKREGPTLADIGFTQQAELFDQVAQWMGKAPVVIDSGDIRANPKVALTKLCEALSIPFSENMLHWPSGGHASDGVWASHWYGAVHRSSGFEDPEGALPDLPSAYAGLVESALPYYERLASYRI